MHIADFIYDTCGYVRLEHGTADMYISGTNVINTDMKVRIVPRDVRSAKSMIYYSPNASLTIDNIRWFESKGMNASSVYLAFYVFALQQSHSDDVIAYLRPKLKPGYRFGQDLWLRIRNINETRALLMRADTGVIELPQPTAGIWKSALHNIGLLEYLLSLPDITHVKHTIEDELINITSFGYSIGATKSIPLAELYDVAFKIGRIDILMILNKLYPYEGILRRRLMVQINHNTTIATGAWDNVPLPFPPIHEALQEALQFECLDFIATKENVQPWCDLILQSEDYTYIRWYASRKYPWSSTALETLVRHCKPTTIAFVRCLGLKITKQEIIACAQTHNKLGIEKWAKRQKS
jgi:hypothetical protein